MNLSQEQQQSILHGNVVPVLIQNTDCLIIRRDIYDRFMSQLAPEDTYAAVLEAWDAAGSPDDGEVYR